MTLQELFDTLNSNIVNGTLTLTDSALDSPAITALFDTYLADQTLVVNDAKLDAPTGGDVVTLTGRVANAPFDTLSITATFALDEAQCAQLFANLDSPGEAWSLGVSFPMIDDTLFTTQVEGAGARLFFNSAADDEAGHPAGLSYTGNLALSGAWALLGWLLAGDSTLPLSGAIGLVGDAPQMTLGAPLGAPIALGNFSLPIRLDLCSDALTPAPATAAPPFAVTYAALSTELTYATQDQGLRLPIEARYYDGDAQLLFRAAIDNPIGSTLDDLSQLLADVSLDDLLPTGWTLPNLLNLTTLELLVNPSTQRLLKTSLGVATTQPFDLITGLLTVEQINLAFALTDWDGDLGTALAMQGELLLGGGLIAVTGYYPDFIFTGDLLENSRIDLRLLAEQFVGPLPDAPSLAVTELHFSAAPYSNSYQIAATVSSDWHLSLGTTQLGIAAAGFFIDTTSEETRVGINGVLTLGSGDDAIELEVLWNLPGDLQITGELPSIALDTLIGLLSADSLDYSLPPFTLERTALFIEENGRSGTLYLAAGTQLSYAGSDWGDFEIEFLSGSGGTGFAMGFVLPQTWSLADLSTLFAPLDWLQFTNLSLIIATVDDPNFQFRAIASEAYSFPAQLPSAPNGVSAGMQLHGDLLLQGGALDTVAWLLGGSSYLDLTARIPVDYSQTTLIAALDGAYHLIDDAVILNDIALTLQPLNLYIDMHMSATFNLFGSSLTLGGDIALEGEEVNFALRTETPWVHPFGIRGLTIDNMGIEFTVGPEVAFSLAGEITIGSGPSQVVVAAGTEFNVDEELPDVLLVEELGTLALAALIQTFTRASVPAVLNGIEMRGFELIVVANPLGWRNPADNKFYSAGLAFRSTLAFYGQVCAFAIQVDYHTGISASGSLSQPLNIGNLLTLTGATNTHEGPYFTIDTASSPNLAFSARLTLYEIESLTILATVASDAFEFYFDYRIEHLGTVTFEATLIDQNQFTTDASAHFTVGDIGPLITRGGRSLGSLNLDLYLDADFTLDLGPATRFSLQYGASFSFLGMRLNLNRHTLHTSLDTFADLVEHYAESLASQLWELAAPILQDASALFSLVSSGIITLTTEIAKILYHELHTTLTDAIGLLKGVAHVMHWGVVDIASMVEDAYHSGIHTLTRALRDAAYDVESVALAIAEVFELGAEDVADILRDVGYGLDEIATVLKNVFGYTAEEVASFFKHAWKIADDLVHDALQGAGYLVNEIEDAMATVFGWAYSAGSTVVYYANPKHW